MATTATIQLNEEQKKELSKALRIEVSQVPESISVIAISSDAADSMGLNAKDVNLSPALIIT